jgi:hypothetical protein
LAWQLYQADWGRFGDNTSVTKAKGRTRIERGVVEVETELEHDPSVWAPDLEGASEERFECELGDPKNMLKARLLCCDGQLQGFALIHLTLYAGRWQEVVRADCAHGKVHLDLMSRKG